MTLFIENAITWASKKKEDIVVGCHFNFYKSDKFSVEVFLPTGLESREYVSVYLVNAEEGRTMDEIKSLLKFVKNGGGLLIGGQSWYHSYSSPILEYTGNR